MRIYLHSLLFLLCLGSSSVGLASAQPQYDLLLQGGRVVDAKNKISAIRDVAIKDGKIAAVAEHIPSGSALKTVSVKGLYVSPGIIDIHVHAYATPGERSSYAGDNSVWPDDFTFRSGVTTVADAGSSGYKNFKDFKEHIIDRSKTRVLAFINIVGAGMRGPKYEDNLADMEPAPAADMAKKYPQVIVGVKTAHYSGPEWTPVENAVKAGAMATIPVMVDFGANRPERPIDVLLTQKLRPGDIYTHCYSGLRNEIDAAGRVNKGMIEGRKRGVIFDVGHGGGSFAWRIALPAIQQGFLPDSISSDLHIGSMNAGMKDMLNIMGKFLALGMSVDDVIAWSTWNPAHEIHHEDLGNLSVGSPADVAVLSLEKGNFGFTDMYGARMDGKQRLECQMTIHNGKIVYDLNGISRPDWKSLPKDYTAVGDSRWDGLNPNRQSH
ncbi:MAG: amidohydrolase/deacetylase family metallohydrolase [Bryobacteraceae bacterium]